MWFPKCRLVRRLGDGLRSIMHPEPGANMHRPFGHEDSSTASLRMQSSRRTGSHHRPSRNAGFGETRRRRYGKRRRARISGQPEEPSASAPGSARSGETWRAASRHRRRVRNSGKPGKPPVGAPRERRFGATRRFTRGTAEGAKTRGNPQIHLRNCRRIMEPGRPGA